MKHFSETCLAHRSWLSIYLFSYTDEQYSKTSLSSGPFAPVGFGIMWHMYCIISLDCWPWFEFFLLYVCCRLYLETWRNSAGGQTISKAFCKFNVKEGLRLLFVNVWVIVGNKWESLWNALKPNWYSFSDQTFYYPSNFLILI